MMDRQARASIAIMRLWYRMIPHAHACSIHPASRPSIGHYDRTPEPWRGTTCDGGGGDPLGDAVARIRSDGVGHHPGVGAQPPHLCASVLAQQVPSDPVQPGAGAGMLGAILAAPPERQRERLGGKIIGQVGADPPPQVAQDRRVVAVEQLREAGRLDQRGGDQLGVVRRGSSGSGPVTPVNDRSDPPRSP
jgi:hypothetical protein